MALAPHLAAQVAHLWGVTAEQVLRGEAAGRGSASPMNRPDVARRDDVAGGVRVRRYTPTEKSHVDVTLVWAHGGGWRYGGLDMPEADSVSQVVCASLGWEVVSVDYRMAPEHTHPAGSDDVAAVCRELHGAGRLVLGGASAGAHLAALAAIELRETGSMPEGLWLVYPAADPLGGPYGDRHPDCPPVVWTDADTVAGMFTTYLGVDVSDAPTWIDDRSIAPARAELGGLPPTLVTTAEVDALEPQGRVLVDALAGADVEVTHHHVESVMHGYLDLVGDEPLADAALAGHIDWLRTLS